jgi:hypothetical protein
MIKIVTTLHNVSLSKVANNENCVTFLVALNKLCIEANTQPTGVRYRHQEI